ncbi:MULTISPECIES: hypothetical protein [unclassified Micromonospora]|uniref:hypothetical protein n=1 Tax=unclassified Micromonospora TaxID=2617518 RepID=UPI001C23CAD5|nr:MULTISPECIES: hypothetical protein [unclassified Micromonospora]MBU8856750.1 hypothetical protein [Micromonospora sp. WMMB482]MDM4782365.1 hypothetical protein [Micromonospora sp. b486]
MTDLDQRITSALREHAEGEIDTGRLLRRSRALGRRRQVRRRATAGTALALVGVLGLTGAIRADVGGLAGRMPWTAATPEVAPPPVPPLADGAPGALQRPDLVGTDPRTLHLGLDTGRARYLGWSVHSSNRVESIRFSVGGGQPVLIEVSPQAQALDDAQVLGFSEDTVPGAVAFDGSTLRVGEAPGGLVTWWRPAPGLYARAAMLGSDQATLKRAVDAVRWDEARRCGGPVRLTTLPANAAVTGCSVDAAAFPKGLTAQLTVFRAPSSTMWMRLIHGPDTAGDTGRGSNRDLEGRPGFLYPDGTRLELLGLPQGRLTVDFAWPFPGDRPAGQVDFTETDAATVLAGAEVAKDLTRPQTWP